MSAETMPAGRELDKLIAERVMGLTVSGQGTDADPYWIDDHQDENGCWLGDYSTEIGWAWEVLERMRSHIGVNDDLWGAFVEQMNIAHDYTISDLLAHASPVSICRAALAALEGLRALTKEGAK